MTYSFNLIEQPWIPCVDTEGSVIELSLRETLVQAHNLRSIAGDSPLETAALYRLLLAVLHSALRGPENAAAWNELWQAGKWDAPWLHDYLGTWKHRFDLFDPERPFYQARDERVKPKTALYLTHGMRTANELFEHASVIEDVKLSCSQAARSACRRGCLRSTVKVRPRLTRSRPDTVSAGSARRVFILGFDDRRGRAGRQSSQPREKVRLFLTIGHWNWDGCGRGGNQIIPPKR